MKLLWLCNNAPGVIRGHITGTQSGGVNWVDHVLSGLWQQGVTVRVLFRGTGGEGALDESCSYASFPETEPWIYRPELEAAFRREIRSFRPDVIHSWGVEYDHALAMVNAAEKEGMLSHMAASIQGLCGFLAEHYTDGLPPQTVNSLTFRDLVRRDNIARQREKFVLRGQLEAQSVGKLRHIIGRTDWDYEKTGIWNPDRQYHFCNETLREPFYEGRWAYADCRKHQIFAADCSYPIKGFHILLEAFAQVLQVYPDATIRVPGRSFLGGDWKEQLRRGSYGEYLAKLTKRHHLEEKIEFLGHLSAEGMKAALLVANVFVLSSTMENSPNSLGEAMLLGLPCIASRVGGVPNLMAEGLEGRIFPSCDAGALAAHIMELFALEEKAEALGQAAHVHAKKTHDPEKNLRDLQSIYEIIR